MNNKTAKITIFSVCIVLGFFLALQLKSVRIHAKDTVPSARIEELSQLLITEQAKNAELNEEIEQYKADVDKFRKEAESTGGYATVLTEQLKRSEILAGNRAVRGPGVTVTLEDSLSINPGIDENAYVVHDSDILRVINELRAAGAEALSLNGERVLATSEIRCAGPTVSINNTRYSAPFVIKAIGEPTILEQSLNMRGGIVDELKTFQIQVKIEKSDNIEISANKKNVTYKYAVPVEEEE